MTSPVQKLTDGDLAPGIYRLDMSLRPETICFRVREAGLACCYVDGSHVIDKETLLAAVADAMSFPDYFGHNWDALEECITDLNWLPASGWVLLIDHPVFLIAHHPDDWSTFFEILQSTVEYWSEKSRTFYAILRNTGKMSQPVPPIS
jgi:hypothetical protein